MTMTTTMRKRKRRSLHPMTTHRPPVRPTPTHQQEGTPGTLSRELLKPSTWVPVSAPVGSPLREGSGPADEPPLQEAGEHRFPDGAGRRHPGDSPPAVRAAPPAAASPLAWTCPHPFTASPPGLSYPHPPSMSQPPLREACPPSDPFPLCLPSHPAATAHPKQEPSPRLCGSSIGPLDTCHGRPQGQEVVMSNRTKVVLREQHYQSPACFHLLSASPHVKVILAFRQQTPPSAISPCTPNKPGSPIP